MSDSAERPSPFTVRQSSIRFSEERPRRGRLHQRSITVGGLIKDLADFADFYEQYEQASEDMQIDVALHGWRRACCGSGRRR
jgi:hypothetical protein